MADSESEYTKERRRRSLVTGLLAISVVLLAVVLAAYAQEAVSGPRIVTRAQTPGLCAEGKYHASCVAKIEMEKRQSYNRLPRESRTAGSVELEGDQPSITYKIKRLLLGEVEVCTLKVRLYQGHVVVLERNSESEYDNGECGILPPG
ncbi:MAG TPA: hypothetical protein VMR75_00220 [Candidatus Saccharimonadales bacterium]|nr:hypothetical protein [Candidatus Saccharimonadales bacterium]